MLVLTRRVGEAIAIDKEIWVTVLEIQGNRVRLGFTAPESIRVVRDELIKEAAHHQPRSKTLSNGQGR